MPDNWSFVIAAVPPGRRRAWRILAPPGEEGTRSSRSTIECDRPVPKHAGAMGGPVNQGLPVNQSVKGTHPRVPGTGHLRSEPSTRRPSHGSPSSSAVACHLAALGYMIYGGRHPVRGVLRHAVRAASFAGDRQGLSPRRPGGARLAPMGMHGRSTWPSLSPMARPASPSVTRARRPDLFGEGRGAVVEGTLTERRLREGDADPRQALRGVPGPARQERSGLQGADQDAPEGNQMIPELGQGIAARGTGPRAGPAPSFPPAGGRTGRPAFVESAQHAALGVFALITCSFALLVYAFLTFDFSVRYVAHIPTWARRSGIHQGVWGSAGGSIILWAGCCRSTR